MSEYILIILWLVVMALFQRYINTETTINSQGKKIKCTAWWYSILAFAPLVWSAVNRGTNIGDTYAYIRTYENMPNSLSQMQAYYQTLNKDKWFYMFEAFVHVFVSKDYKVCFFIIAFFQVFSLAKLYRKYSCSYILSVFIFVACGDYISWMHNGTRQFMAVCICLLATPWMIERKYIPSIITILIASQFHLSALLMIPIFLVCIGKPWNTRTLLVLIGVILSIAFVSQFTTWLDTALDDTQYTNMITNWQKWNDDGTNPIRVIVYSVPTMLSLIGLRYIHEADDKVINFCTNMSIITSGIYLVSMVTSGIFIGRLPIYANLFSNGILLPWELENMFNEESSRYMRIAALAGFAMLYIYQLHFQWKII